MPNLYARLEDLQAALGVTSGAIDSELMALSERVSRNMDRLCGRTFYWRPGQTRYYRANGGAELYLYDDLLSVTTLAVDHGDGSFGTTLVEGVDFYLDPEFGSPKRIVVLEPHGALGSWPFGRRRVRIVGDFGFTNETATVGSVAAGGVTDSATTLELAAGASVSPGDTLVIDSEHLYVSDVGNGAATVERGVNGSVAAAHAASAEVKRVVFPPDLVQAVVMQVSRMQRDNQTGFSGAAGPDYAGFSFASTYPAIRDLLRPLSIPVVA